MNKICLGCGVQLQQEDANRIGYTPKKEADYCQRCFRITHYDDVLISMKQGIDSELVLQKIQEKDALILWVVDLFDFEANMLQGMNRHLLNKDIILVATKRDLLPITLGNEKLTQFIMMRLQALGIVVKGIVICGDLIHNARHEHNDSIAEVEYAIEYYRKDRDVVVMGMANAGKSTLLNAMCNFQTLTTSRHPGTTLDFNELRHHDYKLYDTPGLTRDDSILTHVKDALLKTLIPLHPLKPRVYQLRENQTISLGGLVRLDMFGSDAYTCVAYFSERLPVHRSKQEKANDLWSEHYGKLLSPIMEDDNYVKKVFQYNQVTEKIDVVIHGLGWFCISGNVKTLKVYVPSCGNVTFRKAMM